MEATTAGGAFPADDSHSRKTRASAPADGAGEQLLRSALGDNCAGCAAPLAPDQHYCLECGERRGKPRFSLGAVAGERRAGASAAASGRRRFSAASASSGGLLIGVIALLLLAMGVGVLIGQNGSASGAGGPVQVVTVPGGGGGGAAAATPTTTTDTTPSTQAKPGKGKSTPTKSAPTTSHTVTVVKPAAKVQPGQTCQSGQAGCQNGKFTGTFF